MLNFIEKTPYCLTFLNEAELVNWRLTSKKANEAAACNIVFKPIFDRARFPGQFHSLDKSYYERWIKTQIIIKLNTPKEREWTVGHSVALYEGATFCCGMGFGYYSNPTSILDPSIHYIADATSRRLIFSNHCLSIARIGHLYSLFGGYNHNLRRNIDVVIASINISLSAAISAGWLSLDRSPGWSKDPSRRSATPHLDKMLLAHGIMLLVRGLTSDERFRSCCEKVGTSMRLAGQIALHPTIGCKPRIKKVIRRCRPSEMNVFVRLIDRVTCGCFGRMMRRFY